jgi:hypothetical protein
MVPPLLVRDMILIHHVSLCDCMIALHLAMSKLKVREVKCFQDML